MEDRRALRYNALRLTLSPGKTSAMVVASMYQHRLSSSSHQTDLSPGFYDTLFHFSIWPKYPKMTFRFVCFCFVFILNAMVNLGDCFICVGLVFLMHFRVEWFCRCLQIRINTCECNAVFDQNVFIHYSSITSTNTVDYLVGIFGVIILKEVQWGV